MIAVIDPALFFTSAESVPLSRAEAESIAERLEDALRLCAHCNARIPGDKFYWNRLHLDLIQPLCKRAPKESPRLPQALDRLRGFVQELALAPIPATGQTRMWGLRKLFAWDAQYQPWLRIMEQVLVGAVQSGEEVLFIIRLLEGRNCIRHRLEQLVLEEKTCWRIHANVPGKNPAKIPCVRNLRNRQVVWTTRMDEGLPDSGPYPYCPPRSWWRGPTEVCRTVERRPAWLDIFGNGWAQPLTGGSYHWDVFIDKGLEDEIGVAHLNISAWGSTDRGKKPGEIHHTEKKKSHLQPKKGWSCP